MNGERGRYEWLTGADDVGMMGVEEKDGVCYARPALNPMSPSLHALVDRFRRPGKGGEAESRIAHQATAQDKRPKEGNLGPMTFTPMPKPPPSSVGISRGGRKCYAVGIPLPPGKDP